MPKNHTGSQLDLFIYAKTFQRALTQTKDAELAQKRAERRVTRGTLASWQSVRDAVYKRDEGVCYSCEEYVPEDKFETGHLIDLAMGGTDDLDNLRVMCHRCNRYKPMHASRASALEWSMTSDIIGTCFNVLKWATQQLGMAGVDDFTPEDVARVLELSKKQLALIAKEFRHRPNQGALWTGC